MTGDAVVVADNHGVIDASSPGLAEVRHPVLRPPRINHAATFHGFRFPYRVAPSRLTLARKLLEAGGLKWLLLRKRTVGTTSSS